MSAKQNDGGPAFPQAEMVKEPGADAALVTHGGMSLRDYFAAQALVVINETKFRPTADETIAAEILARFAYSIADAMLKAKGQP